MKKIALTKLLILLLFAEPGYAQTNLYIPNNISSFVGWPIIECGNHVFFLSSREDTVADNTLLISYYFSSVDKNTHTLIKSVLISRDTLFDPQSTMRVSVSYALNPLTKHIGFFSTAHTDNSVQQTAQNLKYPRTISFMQLDTNLDVVVQKTPVIRFDNPGRYTYLGMSLSTPTETGKTILQYAVTDTFARTVVSKFLIADDTGKLLTDEFLGWEPKPYGGYYPQHLLMADGIWKDEDRGYAACVMFEDSISAFWYTLFYLDTNLHLIDTFDYYPDHWEGGHRGVSPPGKRVLTFGTGRENNFFLPGGTMIRSASGVFQDSATGMIYNFVGLGKGGRSSGYRPSSVYFPDPTDTADHTHGVSNAIYSATYNRSDHRIYSYSSTESTNWRLCFNNRSNAGLVTAVDTNLNERWVKYIRPGKNACMITFSLAPPDGRAGVLVSGWETDLTDPYDQTLWKPFIYHIDSSTSLGINNPESPVIISDQFTLYPNPAINQITLENVLGTGYVYSIINSLGQQVLSGKGAGLNTQVDVRQLPAGIYLVGIRTADNRSFSLKLLKE